MLIGEIVSVALGALRANKLRSLLTMLGIVIGVAAVIAMIALGKGAQKAIQDRIAALGTTLLSVNPGQQQGMGGIRSGDQQKMTMDDARAIEERASYITAVQPEMQRQMQVQYLNHNANVSVIGTSANYLEVRKFELDQGRMFTTAHDQARSRVAVIGPGVALLLGYQNGNALLGEPIRIRGIQFEVMGVLKSKGQGVGFGNPDEQILIPISTARFRVFGSDRLRSINVLAVHEDSIPLAMAEIEKVLRREHRLRPGRDDDFNMRSQTDFLETTAQTTQVMSLLLAGIAAVSLIVGGIGIMNIMLVSVTERTREIGVRKALGATRFNILLQFLIEAVVLCSVGGIVGILLGSGTSYVLSNNFQWNTRIDPAAVVLAFAFSAAIGIMFGVWPARRAARLDPIQALRYE
jgi:putative ABC transport system permease protein